MGSNELNEKGEVVMLVRECQRQRRKWLFSGCCLVLLSLFLAIGISDSAYGQTGRAVVYVTPPSFLAKQGGQFSSVNVYISNVANLRSVVFTVAYNKSLLSISQVTQGTFFQAPPKSTFKVEQNSALGLVKISISLAGSGTPRSGSGVLAVLGFVAIQQASACASGVLQLRQVSLLNSFSNPIPFDSISAVYFWKTLLPDPPVQGRMLDVYTQKEGIGMDAFGGFFAIGDEVQLFSLVTYNGDPVQNKPVAFQVFNARNETVLITTAMTDSNGIARENFTIPSLPDSVGTWTVISIVDIAEVSAWDTLTFRVRTSVPVGGYSVPMGQGTDAASIGLAFVSVPLALALVVGETKRMRRRLST